MNLYRYYLHFMKATGMITASEGEINTYLEIIQKIKAERRKIEPKRTMFWISTIMFIGVLALISSGILRSWTIIITIGAICIALISRRVIFLIRSFSSSPKNYTLTTPEGHSTFFSLDPGKQKTILLEKATLYRKVTIKSLLYSKYTKLELIRKDEKQEEKKIKYDCSIDGYTLWVEDYRRWGVLFSRYYLSKESLEIVTKQTGLSTSIVEHGLQSALFELRRRINPAQ